jgi:hypothetical protein
MVGKRHTVRVQAADIVGTVDLVGMVDLAELVDLRSLISVCISLLFVNLQAWRIHFGFMTR